MKSIWATAAGKSEGNAERRWLKAISPPADASMATASNAAFGKWVNPSCFISLSPSYGDNTKKTIMQQLGK
jgi:hypothetical protein